MIEFDKTELVLQYKTTNALTNYYDYAKQNQHYMRLEKNII